MRQAVSSLSECALQEMSLLGVMPSIILILLCVYSLYRNVSISYRSLESQRAMGMIQKQIITLLDNVTIIKSMEFITYFVNKNNIVSKGILTTKNVERLKVIMGILTLSYIVNSLEVKKAKSFKILLYSIFKRESPYCVEIKWI